MTTAETKKKMIRHTSVRLTDGELILLDGSCSAGVQAGVDCALAREKCAGLHEDPMISGFIADVVSEAKNAGILQWGGGMLNGCSLCGRDAGYVKFQRGPRRGQDNHKKPKAFHGVSLARRFFVISGRATLGGCDACIEKARPLLIVALTDVRAKVPKTLSAEGRPTYARHGKMHCTSCDWRGHEGQMRRRNGLIGPGTYASGCPACPAENILFQTPVKTAKGFVVVEVGKS